MHAALNMELDSSNHVPELLRAETLAELEHVCRAAAAACLAGLPIIDSHLVWFDQRAPSVGWVIHDSPLRKHSALACQPIRQKLLEQLHQMACPRWTQAPLSTWLPGSIDPSGQKSSVLLLPLRVEDTPRGGWLLSLPMEWSPNDEVLERVSQVAATLAMLLGKFVRLELLQAESLQMRHLHEALHKAVVAASDPGALSNSLLGILTRLFGIERAFLALYDPQSERLGMELYTGYGDEFVPLSLNESQEQAFFLNALRRGEVVFDNYCEGPPDAEATLRYGDRTPSRRVLIPMFVGARPLGLLYGDQFSRDGAPVFKNVLEAFGREAATAIENLNLRLSAEQRAETDALTGLNNRHFLDKVLQIEIPRVQRYNQPISLLMLDLCDFKRTNDTYGHQFGDYILRETAQLIKANVRRPDVVVRYGGDEFIVLMVNTDQDKAELVRHRIEQAFIDRNRLQTDERRMIHISLGLRSADATTIDQLIHDADMAMYAQKSRQKRIQLIRALLNGFPEKIEAADKMVSSLLTMLNKKLPYYPRHARRVACLALKLARRLNMPDDGVEKLALAALLHGVGKVSLPTDLLLKAAPLSESERAALRSHPQLGEEFFEGIEHLEAIRPIIRSHHERYDGRQEGERGGYPDGLAGERIPLPARILKLAETAESMLSERPWRPAMALDEVTAALREESGQAFDPTLVRLLLADQGWQAGLDDAETAFQLLAIDNITKF